MGEEGYGNIIREADGFESIAQALENSQDTRFIQEKVDRLLHGEKYHYMGFDQRAYLNELNEAQGIPFHLIMAKYRPQSTSKSHDKLQAVSIWIKNVKYGLNIFVYYHGGAYVISLVERDKILPQLKDAWKKQGLIYGRKKGKLLMEGVLGASDSIDRSLKNKDGIEHVKETFNPELYPYIKDLAQCAQIESYGKFSGTLIRVLAGFEEFSKITNYTTKSKWSRNSFSYYLVLKCLLETFLEYKSEGEYRRTEEMFYTLKEVLDPWFHGNFQPDAGAHVVRRMNRIFSGIDKASKGELEKIYDFLNGEEGEFDEIVRKRVGYEELNHIKHYIPKIKDYYLKAGSFTPEHS